MSPVLDALLVGYRVVRDRLDEEHTAQPAAWKDHAAAVVAVDTLLAHLPQAQRDELAGRRDVVLELLLGRIASGEVRTSRENAS